jgi:hypothetical protein
LPTLIARRKFITGAAALTLLAGCERHLARALAGLMRCWNENFESLMFSPSRLAPELRASEQTAEKDFPISFHSPSIPVAPSNWSSES